MDTGKPTRTLADWLVIAVSPVLIMVLVHSFCFFLVEVFYRSEAMQGVRWVLFWFVLAVVLISRIGMEQGDTQAMGYGLALAGATWAYLAVVQHEVVFGAILLACVWFTAHKLTSNCTLIDEDADASGQGLLASLQRLPTLFKRRGAAPPPEPEPTTKPVASPAGRAMWIHLKPTPKPKPKVASAVPGVWLIYYSLAALPLFGLGQMLLPTGDTASRRLGFVYLFCYLTAALGLLLTTSFLGLRRYLRQRYLAMPDTIALGWIQFGVVAAVAVLGLSLLLPRPGAGEAWGALRYHVDYQLRRASEYAAQFNPHGTGQGRAGHEAAPNGQSENPGSAPQSNPNPDGSSGSAGNVDHGGQSSGPATQSGTPAGNGSGSGQSNRPLPELSPAASTLYAWVKWLFGIVALLGLGWLCYRYRDLFVLLLRNLWTAIRNFIQALLGRVPAIPAKPAPKKKEAPPFQTFKNPFLTGGAELWSAEKLITYSYDALQSWAMETAPGGLPQTPREFCRQLGGEMPEVASALEHLAFLYGHVAYGALVPGSYQPQQLRQLWEHMAQYRQLGRKRQRSAHLSRIHAVSDLTQRRKC